MLCAGCITDIFEFGLFGEPGGEGFSGLVDFLESGGALEDVKEVAVLHVEGLDIAFRGEDLGVVFTVLRLKGVAADPYVSFLLDLKFSEFFEAIVRGGGDKSGPGEFFIEPGVEGLAVEVEADAVFREV